MVSTLAARPETGTAPYPTSLGGIGRQVVDSAGEVDVVVSDAATTSSAGRINIQRSDPV